MFDITIATCPLLISPICMHLCYVIVMYNILYTRKLWWQKILMNLVNYKKFTKVFDRNFIIYLVNHHVPQVCTRELMLPYTYLK